MGPFLGYWMTLFWWIYEAAAFGLSAYGSNGTTFLVVKLLLGFVYSLVGFLFTWELMWPILDWWQKLEQLATFVPYVRPTEAEVEKNDYN